jgi:nitrogen regulatory protein P-II 1
MGLDISGMTVTEVRGFGRERGTQVDFVPKLKVEIVADVMVADDVVKAIGDAARTGEIGDGTVWVNELNQVMRIRTGEMGLDALT